MILNFLAPIRNFRGLNYWYLRILSGSFASIVIRRQSYAFHSKQIRPCFLTDPEQTNGRNKWKNKRASQTALELRPLRLFLTTNSLLLGTVTILNEDLEPHVWVVCVCPEPKPIGNSDSSPIPVLAMFFLHELSFRVPYTACVGLEFRQQPSEVGTGGLEGHGQLDVGKSKQVFPESLNTCSHLTHAHTVLR